MIDLHMHSIYSDGDKTIEENLKTCESKGLKYISLTDHNTIKQYDDPALHQNLFSGKIIKGLEMDAFFQNKKIEILAYKIKNTEVIDNWNQKFFSKERRQLLQEKVRQKLIEACDKNKLIYDKSILYQEIPENDYISVYIYNELMKHPENIPVLGELANSLNAFIRKGLLNPESDYCVVAKEDGEPNFKDMIDTIHQAGGLAFLAHPFEYRFTNTIQFINEFRAQKELDGIECFHPSATKEQQKLLLDYAKTNALFVSGGCDSHGNKTPDRQIGHLNILKQHIENWVNL